MVDEGLHGKITLLKTIVEDQIADEKLWMKPAEELPTKTKMESWLQGALMELHKAIEEL